jgi:hypothetical protein
VLNCDSVLKMMERIISEDTAEIEADEIPSTIVDFL